MGGASELIFLSKTIPKIVKIFRPAAPKWGRRPSFDLRRAPQAGSGGVEAFLGENCPNPRDLSATSPAPEAFLAVPQHVIFAFRFQNELALFFFWGQNELAQFSSEGGFELALFFFWADFGFFLGPFRASSVSWLYRPGPKDRPGAVRPADQGVWLLVRPAEGAAGGDGGGHCRDDGGPGRQDEEAPPPALRC